MAVYTCFIIDLKYTGCSMNHELSDFQSFYSFPRIVFCPATDYIKIYILKYLNHHHTSITLVRKHFGVITEYSEFNFQILDSFHTTPDQHGVDD